MDNASIIIEGKTLSFDDIKKQMSEMKELQKKLKELNKVRAEAKKAGLIAGKVAAKEKPEEVKLLATQFQPTVEANSAIIAKLFTDTYSGQDSISFAVNEKYSIIIRDMDITKEKAKARKAKELEEAERKELATLKALTPEVITDAQTKRQLELEEKYKTEREN